MDGASSAGWGTSERLSGTVTFLFSDIEGSTALLKGAGRERYGELLARHQALVREAFIAHRGREVDTQGDAFFVAFHGASDAVAAAVAIQRALAAEAWPEGTAVRVRIGIHSGEASAAGERYVGFSVHRAARVGALGHGGQILISSATRVLVEDDLPEGVSLRDVGAHRLKDVERPERLAQVVAAGLAGKFPPLGPRRRRRVDRRLVATAAALLIAGAVVTGLLLVHGGNGGAAQAAAPVAADSVGIFGAGNGHQIAQTPVGTSPGAIAADSESVWVANVDDGSLSRLDPDTGAVKQTVAVGDGPAGLAIAAGSVWVTDSLDGTVRRVDERTNVPVQTVHVGSQPNGIAFGLGAVWVANAGDRTLVQLDPQTGRVRKTIPLGSGVDALAVGKGALWVASELNGTVERVDPESGSTQTINVGRAPDAIAVGADAVWVANNLDGTVSRVDPATNSVVDTIAVGAGPVAIAVSPGDKRVWVSNELGGSLSMIDPGRNRVSRTIAIGDRPNGLALAGDRLFAAVRTAGRAHRGGTLTLALAFHLAGAKAEFLDPAIDYGYWFLGNLTNDGLVAFRRAGGGEGLFLVPDLATALPTPTDDGRTYTFEVRQGIHYSNGRLVRPADFRRPLERAFTSGPGNVYFTDLVGAAACLANPSHCDLSRGITTGANTVTFHLTRPDPEFLYKLAVPTAESQPADTPLKPRFPLPATGPYMFARFVSRRGKVKEIRLVRNPRFKQWSAAARPDGYPDVIDFRYGYSADAAVRAVESGAADLTGIDSNTAPALRAMLALRFRGQLHSNPTLGTSGVALNTRVPPFDDRRVRQALNYALDRAHVVALAGGIDFASATCQMVPPNLAGYSQYCPYMRGHRGNGPYTRPDLTKALRLVAASQTRGQTILFHAVEGNPQPIKSYIVGLLRRLGYNARLVTVSPTEVRDGDSRYRWQMNTYNGWNADFPAASNFFVPILTCASFKPRTSRNSNSAEFCDPKIDGEVARALALEAGRPQAAARQWAKVDHDVTDQAPWLAYFTPRTVEFVSSRVGNYVYSGMNFGALLDQLWVR